MQMLAYLVVCGMLGLLLLQGRGVEAAQGLAPDCSMRCNGKNGVRHEMVLRKTDKAITCKLNPVVRNCILERCNTSTLPAAFVNELKITYGCAVSASAPPLHLPVLAAMFSLVVAALLFKS